MSRFQDWLRIRRSRSTPVQIPAHAKFPIDRSLVSRQLREHERLKALGVVPKAVRETVLQKESPGRGSAGLT